MSVVRRATTTWNSWSPYFLSVLRIVAAFQFIQHGSMKLLAFPASVMPTGGTLPVSTLPGFAGLLETGLGPLLLLGLFTRPLAFILAGEMAVAYFTVHAPQGFWPILNGGESATLFCFLWLYISAMGPGPWSLDALLRRKPASAQAT